MQKPEFIVPAVTAFTPDGAIDEGMSFSVFDRLIDKGVSGILLLGSTGEFFTISQEERLAFTHHAIKHIGGRTQVLVGTGANSLHETIELSNDALMAGADGILVITPFYFQLGHKGIVDYLSEVAHKVCGDMYLYNFPDRTGNDINASVVRELLTSCPNVVGIKDTVQDMSHTRAIIDVARALRPDFKIYAGMDENFAHNLLAGGNGSIAALANVYPELTSAWTNAAASANLNALEHIQRVIDGLAELYDVAPLFIPIIKYAMSQRGFGITPTSRATLESPCDAQRHVVADILARADKAIQKHHLI